MAIAATVYDAVSVHYHMQEFGWLPTFAQVDWLGPHTHPQGRIKTKSGRMLLFEKAYLFLAFKTDQGSQLPPSRAT